MSVLTFRRESMDYEPQSQNVFEQGMEFGQNFEFRGLAWEHIYGPDVLVMKNKIASLVEQFSIGGIEIGVNTAYPFNNLSNNDKLAIDLIERFNNRPELDHVHYTCELEFRTSQEAIRVFEDTKWFSEFSNQNQNVAVDIYFANQIARRYVGKYATNLSAFGDPWYDIEEDDQIDVDVYLESYWDIGIKHDTGKTSENVKVLDMVRCPFPFRYHDLAKHLGLKDAVYDTLTYCLRGYYATKLEAKKTFLKYQCTTFDAVKNQAIIMKRRSVPPQSKMCKSPGESSEDSPSGYSGAYLVLLNPAMQ